MTFSSSPLLNHSPFFRLFLHRSPSFHSTHYQSSTSSFTVLHHPYFNRLLHGAFRRSLGLDGSQPYRYHKIGRSQTYHPSIMNFLKSYVRPHGQGKARAPPAATPMEMAASGKSSHLKIAENSHPGTRSVSRPISLYPDGDFRNTDFTGINVIKCAIASEWLHQQQQKMQIYHATLNEGVVLKRAQGDFISCPEFLTASPLGLHEAASSLNAKVSQEWVLSFV